MKFRLVCLLLVSIVFVQQAKAQETLSLTLEEAISMAIDQGPSARIAKLDHDESRWNYRSFQAGYKPSLSLFANTPGFVRSLNSAEQDDGSLRFVSHGLNSS